MKRFIEGENRFQSTLFPESLEDYIAKDNSIRIVDAFIDKLPLKQLGFAGAEPSATGRPGYQPATLLKIYLYGYLNRIQSSRRLERESHRNVELIWLTGRLMPDFKTIADFRKDNRQAIRRVCMEFVGVCREFNLFSATLVAIDGSKFKAVNSRDKNFTKKSVKRRQQKTQANIDRYLAKLDAVDKEEPEIREVTAKELKQKIASMQAKMEQLKQYEAEVEAHPDSQVSLTDPDARSMIKAGGGSTVSYKESRCHAPAQAPGRTSLRHHQALDGIDAFSNETITKRSGRDESARTGLQSQTRNQRSGRVEDPGTAADRLNEPLCDSRRIRSC
jgi:transposase